MKIKRCFILVLFLIFSINTFGQTIRPEYFITVNGNLCLPVNTHKGMYPILGYDKNTKPKLLIGGFGAGITAFKAIQNKVYLKAQANLSKHTYWDEPIVINDESGYNLGTFLAGSSDYAAGIAATVQYALTNKILIGTGFGTQVLLISLSRLPQINDTKKLLTVNRYYKPFVPVLPVELTYKSQKTIFNIRYEQGLLNRFKNNLKNHSKEKLGLLTFEIGFKVNK